LKPKIFHLPELFELFLLFAKFGLTPPDFGDALFLLYRPEGLLPGSSES